MYPLQYINVSAPLYQCTHQYTIVPHRCVHLNLMIPNHSPEVVDSVWQWSLCCYVSHITIISLWGGTKTSSLSHHNQHTFTLHTYSMAVLVCVHHKHTHTHTHRLFSYCTAPSTHTKAFRDMMMVFSRSCVNMSLKPEASDCHSNKSAASACSSELCVCWLWWDRDEVFVPPHRDMMVMWLT